MVAMNAFKGSLSAFQACTLVARGFKQGFPEASITEIPLADGGDGTVDVLVAAKAGEFGYVKVTGPYGKPVEAKIGLLLGDTVVIESAACSGLALTEDGERKVFEATSLGVGQLMIWAARQGAKRILVGVGGTATNDGGLGMVTAAGGKALDALDRPVVSGINGLKQVFRIHPGHIPRYFKGVEVIAICDVKNLLTGPRGATKVYGPQKGVCASRLDEVDSYMENYAGVLARDLGRDPRQVEGAGAGGGLAAALWAFFGAKLVPGAPFILEETGFLDQIAGVDLIVTGEGRVDFQTEQGKVPHAVAEAGLKHGVPTLVLGGSLDGSVLRKQPKGFCCVFDCITGPGTLEDAIGNTKMSLPFKAKQIASLVRSVSLLNPLRRELCSGGVVIRRNLGKTQILMIEDRFGFMALPKGHVDSGESLEQAALREVEEETGVLCRIIAPIGRHSYGFFHEDGHPVKKTVQYFVMSQRGGEIRPQPGETTKVTWIDKECVPFLNIYANIKGIIDSSLTVYDKTSP